MTLYDAAMQALIHGKAVRRPSMPPGVTIVPVLSEADQTMKAFLVAPMPSGRFTGWNPTVDDLVAQDWHVAHWNGTTPRHAEKRMIDCG